MKKISYCRNCKNDKFEKLFSLGNLSYTGKFPKQQKTNIKKETITLIMCNKCKLVQLDRNFNLNYMFGKNYGYRSAINKTMKSHLESLTKKIEKKFNIKNGDYVYLFKLLNLNVNRINSYRRSNFLSKQAIVKKFKSNELSSIPTIM